MKKTLSLIAALLCALALAACTLAEEDGKPGGGQDNFTSQLGLKEKEESAPRENFKRAVWVSYIELAELLSADEARFSNNLDEMFYNLETIKTTDIFLQVRAFGEALYSSELFPSASLLYSDYSEDINYLERIVSEAHERGMRLHAWINPYRLGEYPELIEALKNLDRESVISLESGSFIDPASEALREAIIGDISALCNNYEVDGVQFDDYFYPFAEEETDAARYESYLASGGELALEGWRRENVTALISGVYAAVHVAGEDMVFGVSPDASIERNMTRHYADVEKWCSGEGFIDYICPQIYYGYENETRPFNEAVEEWKELSASCELIVGLSPYKAGRQDAYAGSGSSEWLESFDIISRQYSDASKDEAVAGVAFFRYGSLFSPEESVEAFASLELYALQKAVGYEG
ncbi:MAG: family 10 glycosylhydrolase [Oscillospiraceae bacterium]|nr:family 10 glycosylhydrolase [Oscillospiraceae bacterium]